MTEDYQNLPYDTVYRLAHNGDFEAYKELVRRHTVNIAHKENGAKARPAENPVRDENSVAVQPAEYLARNPDVRKPHIWVAFVFWMLWKKLSIIAEPAGICILLYAIYRLAHDTYVGMHDWGTPSEKAVTYATALILVIVLSKVTNMWLRLAWERRPLTIWLVIGAVIFWYDGIPFI